MDKQFRQDILETLILEGSAAASEVAALTRHPHGEVADALDEMELDGEVRPYYDEYAYCGGPISEVFARA